MISKASMAILVAIFSPVVSASTQNVVVYRPVVRTVAPPAVVVRSGTVATAAPRTVVVRRPVVPAAQLAPPVIVQRPVTVLSPVVTNSPVDDVLSSGRLIRTRGDHREAAYRAPKGLCSRTTDSKPPAGDHAVKVTLRREQRDQQVIAEGGTAFCRPAMAACRSADLHNVRPARRWRFLSQFGSMFFRYVHITFSQ